MGHYADLPPEELGPPPGQWCTRPAEDGSDRVLWLLEAQTCTACASLVVVILIVTIIRSSMIITAPLAPCCEVLDESAFGEVVPVGGVEFAPLVIVLAKRSGLPFATHSVSPGCGLGHPSMARTVVAFRLFA